MPTAHSARTAAGDPQVVTGRLDNLGDGLRCPEILTEDNRRVAVFGLAADIPPGTRLRLTGQPGRAVRCKGEVLIIQTIEILGD